MSGENAASPQGLSDKPQVVISSTSFDLPEHRKQVILGCNRMDCDTLAMENLTAEDTTATDVSLRLVDEADIYIGIFAHRYGFCPPENNPDNISITEMEYNRAVERGIPRLIFFMHDDHPVRAKDVETGPGAGKLARLKRLIGESRVATFFTSETELRSHVVEALSQLRKRKTTKTAADFHYVRPIPKLDEPYIAHPYTLLAESRGLVGRQEELNLLTDWVARPTSTVFRSSLLFLVAIGGMGKSALTWHWFQNIARQEMPDLQGQLWWSFYESDATFENFVIRSLAYFSGQSIDQVKALPVAEREMWLLHCLDKSPHLIVLDGLERILLAYNQHNALSRMDDDQLDDETANRVAGAHGLPESAGQSYVGRNRLRLTTDPRAGQFLRKLTHVQASRVLVSTRLFPSDLQRDDGFPVGNCFAYFVPGLSDEDAVDLWRGFGARGPRDELLSLFESFERHPLLIQTLASEVCRSRAANGDYATWKQNQPDFNPFQFVETSQRKGYILRHALHGITDEERRLLSTVAAFRMPTTYETLSALSLRLTAGPAGRASNADDVPEIAAHADNQQTTDTESPPPETRGPLGLRLNDASHLDVVLTDLEDRGLLGWDRRANRYDLHPIVRGVVLSGLTESSRTDIYTTLHAHFEPIDTPEWKQVESLDDLTPAIELFNTLIELERYDDAYTVFRDRISKATLYRLSASHLRVELAERLFPDGVDQPPQLSRASAQGFTLNVLASGYHLSGQPGAAVPVFRRLRKSDEQENSQQDLSVTLCNLSDAQRFSGDVRGAEASARTALQISRDIDDSHAHGVNLYRLGLALAVRSAASNVFEANSLRQGTERTQLPPHSGSALRADSPTDGTDATESRATNNQPEAAFRRSLQLWQQQNNQQCEGLVNAFLAEVALWRGDPESARALAARAWELASVNRQEADFIRAARLQGAAALRSAIPARHASECVPSADPESAETHSLVLRAGTEAHERLHHALTRARACQRVEEELPTLIALAELHLWKAEGRRAKDEDHRPDQAQRRSGSSLSEVEKPDGAGTSLRSVRPADSDDNTAGSPIGLPEAAAMQTSLNATPAEHLAQARELLDDVWDRAEAGPYPLFHADAFNILAAIEQTTERLIEDGTLADDNVDHRAAAIAAAQQAYENAWLQSPPFAYAFGLTNAQAHLDALEVAYPEMPPYDDSLYEPMPEVDIAPEE